MDEKLWLILAIELQESGSGRHDLWQGYLLTESDMNASGKSPLRSSPINLKFPVETVKDLFCKTKPGIKPRNWIPVQPFSKTIKSCWYGE